MSLRFSKYTQEDFVEAIASSRSIRQTLLSLGVSAKESNYAAARRRIDVLKLDTSHFSRSGPAYKRGRTFPVEEYLVKNCNRISSHNLKLRLFEEGIFERQCSSCHLIEWMERPMPLELNHIDGDHFNNEIGNLEILCLNCHAFTPIYRGRGRKMIKRKQVNIG